MKCIIWKNFGFDGILDCRNGKLISVSNVIVLSQGVEVLLACCCSRVGVCAYELESNSLNLSLLKCLPSQISPITPHSLSIIV